MWMPVAEVYDYIQLINKQTEEENAAYEKSHRGKVEKSDTPTLSDVYRGPIG